RHTTDRVRKTPTTSELDDKDPEPALERKRKSYQFGDRIRDAADNIMGPQADWFRSDHAYDSYISPVTNPFLFEDPRSLTEIRPIFLFQKVPTSQNNFGGGNIIFFGAQARVAITERWSFVINKFGGISENPSTNSGLGSNTGFAELWLGPKYTF